MDFYVEERSYSAEDKEVGIGLNQNKKHWIKHLQKNTKIFLVYGKFSEDESVSTNGKRFVKPMENAIHETLTWKTGLKKAVTVY